MLRFQNFSQISVLSDNHFWEQTGIKLIQRAYWDFNDKNTKKIKMFHILAKIMPFLPKSGDFWIFPKFA